MSSGNRQEDILEILDQGISVVDSVFKQIFAERVSELWDNMNSRVLLNAENSRLTISLRMTFYELNEDTAIRAAVCVRNLYIEVCPYILRPR